jgi:hypothetical protein
MSSKYIYPCTIPYFYIIQHKESKKLYVGARWAKSCKPDEFMQPTGYTTSSPTINSIIDQEGLDSFEILRIDTNLDGISAYDYETLFLQCLDCASSPDWYNGHNNDNKCPAFGTKQFKQLMLNKYGNEFFNNPIKNKETCLKKYGVDSYKKTESSRLKASINTSILNKREDMIAILLERNTNNNPSKLPKNRINSSNRFKNTNYIMLKQGTHPMQKQSNKDAASERMKITMANLPLLICPYCNKEGKGSNMSRWHFKNCKLKP